MGSKSLAESHATIDVVAQRQLLGKLSGRTSGQGKSETTKG